MKYLTLVAFLGSVDAANLRSQWVTASDPSLGWYDEDKCGGENIQVVCTGGETCAFWLWDGRDR